MSTNTPRHNPWRNPWRDTWRDPWWDTWQNLLQTTPRRRQWLTLVGVSTCLGGLSACSDGRSPMPKPNYGKAIDLTQRNTYVEFDIHIEKPDLYDVVLEIFEKNRAERMPDKVFDTPHAHFKVFIQSLDRSGKVIVEKEVKKSQQHFGTLSGKSFGPSATEKNDLMRYAKYLVYQQPFQAGTFRVRCDNLHPISALKDRLVKVSVELIRT